MEKQKIIKVVVVIVVLALIFGVWVFRNSEELEKETINLDENVDLALDSSVIDLDVLKEYEMPIIIDFGADWCEPCREMEPVLETLNTVMKNKAIIKFADIYKHPDAQGDFPVRVMPTQFFFNKDGTPYLPSVDLGIEFLTYKNSNTGELIYTAHEGGLTEEQLRLVLKDMGVE